jgi:hypothetical protein
MITSIVVVALLVGFGAGGAMGAECAPNITYYAPIPLWWPKYIGVPYSDYQVVHYVTPPEVTAVVVKQRILAVNATNPALLSPLHEPLPAPTPQMLPPPQKK